MAFKAASQRDARAPPQPEISAGASTCEVQRSSAKAKGWVLDQFLAAEMAGYDYLHVMGFEAGETSRDAGYGTAQQTGSYPL